MDERIVREPHVWDLHIHTPLGTPQKKNYNNCSSEEFVDALLSIYRESGKPIHMISFTDHNQINVEVYSIFRKKSTIAIIPGIEMDIFLRADDRFSKHIIFYFPETELDNLYELNSFIQNYREKNQRVVFESFVMELLHNKKQFAVSPHAFKQDKRGINFTWNDPDSADIGFQKFSGLFFPFWEAAGTSDIVKAIEFLEDRSTENSEDHAIIAFSDSADYEKIKRYIEKPYQYFLCLNSFKGLLLAGSDRSRIIDTYENRPTYSPSEKVKCVSVNSNVSGNLTSEKIQIEFSDRLTAIIGGRGKGKSALLDAIVYAINPTKIEDSNRAKFVKKFGAIIENYAGTSMVADLNVQYFSQSYINSLFSGDSSQNLYTYFKSYFDRLPTLTADIAELLSAKTELQKKRPRGTDVGNIVDDLKNMTVIPHAKVYPEIKRSNCKQISVFDSDKHQGFDKSIKTVLPKSKDLWANADLQKAFSNFVVELVYSIYQQNYAEQLNKAFACLVKKRADAAKQAQSKQDAEKAKSREKLEAKLRYTYVKEMERVFQINELYSVPAETCRFDMEYTEQQGEGDNCFYFVSYVNREHPVEYGRRKICEALDKRITKAPQLKTNEELFVQYAFGGESLSNQLNSQMSVDELQIRIDDMADINHILGHKIIYRTGHTYTDLHETSPGTQTNAIMELMLHSDSTTPMFLDQPEDNIDNEARFAKLTKWIKTQKYKRQIIVVTHDANVVINGDAECVIIADHDDRAFRYSYGALEYGDILDRASVILDGGKSAIRKRIEKYGE